jgi:hypothetical protein
LVEKTSLLEYLSVLYAYGVFDKSDSIEEAVRKIEKHLRR